MPRPSRTMRTAAGALALLVSAAACGIPTDDQPRAIAPSSTASPATNSPTTMEPNSTNGAVETVYLVEGGETAAADGERLAPRTVQVPNTSDPAQLVKSTLEQLIALPSENGLTNALPNGTTILAASLNEDGTELTIDLSEEFNDVQQSLQRRAFAQLVFSATGVTPSMISRVRFLIDGVPKAASTDNEVTPAAGDAVSRSDYPSFEQTMASTTTDIGPG